MTVTILTGDCRNVLPTMPDNSVHCVVTSPPYWGLRDYGTATWEGGDPTCDHKQGRPGGNPHTSLPTEHQRNRDGVGSMGGDCQKCGARRIDSQIGLEIAYADYVETMCAVFREVRRVLRLDGTVWLNLGDSYAGLKGFRPEHAATSTLGGGKNHIGLGRGAPLGDLKQKDLVGIPWRVAFALQADGWYLRSDIIWSKPNPMPESVTDRPTKAHEYLFLLAKSERYYYDATAIAEPASPVSLARYAYAGEDTRINKGGRYKAAYDAKDPHIGLPTVLDNPETRNKRSVWEVTTQPFSEAHFATFPPALIGPCILAGCPKECCARCGAPWVREVEAERFPTRPGLPIKADASRNDGGRADRIMTNRKTTGFSPSCSCGTHRTGLGEDVWTTELIVPGTVLDPFGGAGTTGLVADRLGRNAILIELNESYAEMARRRIHDDAPLFVELA